MVYDGYAKYEEAEIHRSAIIQDLRDSEEEKKKKIQMEKKKNDFGFFGVKFFMGYPCVRHYILFYIYGPVILHFLS